MDGGRTVDRDLPFLEAKGWRDDYKGRAVQGEWEHTRGGCGDEGEERERLCEARKRSEIEATKRVRRIGSEEKDWWWTETLKYP